METQSAFIRTDGTVELNAPSGIHLDIAVAVDPRNLKCDDAFRNGKAFQNAVLFNTRIRLDHTADGLKKFLDRLKKFRFPRSLLFPQFKNPLCICVHYMTSCYLFWRVLLFIICLIFFYNSSKKNSFYTENLYFFS